MLPYIHLLLADQASVKLPSGAMSMFPIVRDTAVNFVNPQMYRRWVSTKVPVWVIDNPSEAILNQGLIPGINEIIRLDCIQPPTQDKFEPTDTLYMSMEQLAAFAEQLGGSPYEEELEVEAE